MLTASQGSFLFIGDPTATNAYRVVLYSTDYLNIIFTSTKVQDFIMNSRGSGSTPDAHRKSDSARDTDS